MFLKIKVLYRHWWFSKEPLTSVELSHYQNFLLYVFCKLYFKESTLTCVLCTGKASYTDCSKSWFTASCLSVHLFRLPTAPYCALWKLQDKWGHLDVSKELIIQQNSDFISFHTEQIHHALSICLVLDVKVADKLPTLN